MKVNVRVEELLVSLSTNRTSHRDLFLKAQDAFKAKAIEVFEARLESARNGGEIEQYLNLVEPVDQTAEYDTAIAMMEMSSDDTIELDQETFECYVLDKWHWAGKALMANSTYIR